MDALACVMQVGEWSSASEFRSSVSAGRGLKHAESCDLWYGMGVVLVASHRLAATSGLAPLHLARACVIRRVKITRPWMRILPEHWPRITGVPLDALLTGGIGQGSRQFVTYRIKVGA